MGRSANPDGYRAQRMRHRCAWCGHPFLEPPGQGPRRQMRAVVEDRPSV